MTILSANLIRSENVPFGLNYKLVYREIKIMYNHVGSAYFFYNECNLRKHSSILSAHIPNEILLFIPL